MCFFLLYIHNELAYSRCGLTIALYNLVKFSVTRYTKDLLINAIIWFALLTFSIIWCSKLRLQSTVTLKSFSTWSSVWSVYVLFPTCFLMVYLFWSCFFFLEMVITLHLSGWNCKRHLFGYPCKLFRSFCRVCVVCKHKYFRDHVVREIIYIQDK